MAAMPRPAAKRSKKSPVSSPAAVRQLPAATALGVWPLLEVADDGGAVLLVDGARLAASVDPAVDVAVLRTAARRGERVVAQREGGVWLVVGALRVSATPGVDEMDEVVVRGNRVYLEGTHEISVRSGAASLVLRAQGYVETMASDITTRARAVHKLVGRVLRLN
jgi:hypothetical protein